MVAPNGQIVVQFLKNIFYRKIFFTILDGPPASQPASQPGPGPVRPGPSALRAECPARPVRSGPGRSGRGCRDGAGPGRSRIPCYKFLALLFFSERRQGPGRAAPGRPGLLYEPNQNGRKSGRGGFEAPRASDRTRAFPEKPRRTAEKHSRGGGDKHKVRVSRPRGGKSPGKHAKTTVFNATAGTPACQGCKPPPTASPINKLCSQRPRTGLMYYLARLFP